MIRLPREKNYNYYQLLIRNKFETNLILLLSFYIISILCFFLQEINKKLAEREKLSAEKARSSENGSLANGNLSKGGGSNPNSDASQMSAITNLLVIIGFAIFAWTVKYVINSLGEDNG